MLIFHFITIPHHKNGQIQKENSPVIW